MTRRMALLAVVALACIVAVGVWAGRQPQDRQLLREVYSPTFGDVPPEGSIADTIAQLHRDLTSPAGREFLARLLPDQAAALWISIIVAFGVAFDFWRPRSWRNVDLVLMLLLGMTFFDIMRLFRVPLDPVYWRLLDGMFTAITALNAALLIRAVWHARTTASGRPWQPNLRGPALAALAVLLLAANILVALEESPTTPGTSSILAPSGCASGAGCRTAIRSSPGRRAPHTDPSFTLFTYRFSSSFSHARPTRSRARILRSAKTPATCCRRLWRPSCAQSRCTSQA